MIGDKRNTEALGVILLNGAVEEHSQCLEAGGRPTVEC